MEPNDHFNAAVIDERDELIAALTQQLEYAAEQLDRYQRAGAPSSSGSIRTNSSQPALSPELNEGLIRFLEQWDQMQAGFTLGRIEVQLDEIKDLISTGGGNHTQIVSSSPPNDLSSILSAFSKTQASEQSTEKKSYEPNSWDKIKSSFQGAANATTDTRNNETSRDLLSFETSPFQEQRESSQSIDQAEIINILGLELPALVDFENATSEQLEDAIQFRDEVIATLLGKAAEIYQRASHIIDLSTVTGLEAEKAVIDELHDRLTEQLKIAELQNSLERARLSREQSKLKQKELLIEKKMLQLGITSEHPSEATKQLGKTEPKRGWLR